MNAQYVQSSALMGTVVTMHVVGHGDTPDDTQARAEAVTRAFAWFHHVEATCSRFDDASELRQLSSHIGEPVAVSPLVFHAVQFALAVADDSGGAFDPTVGRRMERLGFNAHYRDASLVNAPFDTVDVSWRDVRLDEAAQTITLQRALVLDLGAVAKGLAIDMAVRELQPFGDFVIDAGGDLYFGGHSPRGDAWHVGIRDPRDTATVIDTLAVSDIAVCTSGDYERRVALHDATHGTVVSHHLLDARAGRDATALASVTVLSPSAMVADALATAAFALGPTDGAALLERHAVDALLITPTRDRITTGHLPRA